MDKKIPVPVSVIDGGYRLWIRRYWYSLWIRDIRYGLGGGYRYPLWIRRYSLWMGDIHHGLEDIRYGWGISIMDKEIFLMDGG